MRLDPDWMPTDERRFSRRYSFGGCGTFAPLRRASDNAMAMACLGFFTFSPLLLRSVPFLRRRIVRSTLLTAASPYRSERLVARLVEARFVDARLVVVRFDEARLLERLVEERFVERFVVERFVVARARLRAGFATEPARFLAARLAGIVTPAQ
jgi:hypothetical protein